MVVDRLIVINLDRTPERFARFNEHNPAIPVERFSAIDGWTLERSRCIADGLITDDNVYGPGAVGCMCSHVALWRRCAAEQRPLHVAEDDALLRRDFFAAASAALDQLGDWDFVLWAWNMDWPLEVRLAPGLGSALVHGNPGEIDSAWPDFFDGTAQPAMAQLLSAAGLPCYSVSPQGARRLLDILPVGAKPASYVLHPGADWTNTSLSIELSRHHAGWKSFVALPPLALTLNRHAESTIYNP